MRRWPPDAFDPASIAIEYGLPLVQVTDTDELPLTAVVTRLVPDVVAKTSVAGLIVQDAVMTIDTLRIAVDVPARAPTGHPARRQAIMRIKKIDRDDPSDLLMQKMNLNDTFISKRSLRNAITRIATATVMVNNLSMKIRFRTIVSAQRLRTISMGNAKLIGA
jgi:hypothetical protein